MGAAYGPQGIVSGRPAGPGWPRKPALNLDGNPTDFPARVIVVRTDQSVRLPDWCSFVRMGATGRGGDGSHNGTSNGAPAGGGGGFAGTNAIRAPFGGVINVRFAAQGTIVEAFGYILIGGNGVSALVSPETPGPGGVGSGGDVNFNGGAGSARSTSTNGGGGGAAGRGGNGSAGGLGVGGAGAPATGFFSSAAGGGARTTAGSGGVTPPGFGAAIRNGTPGSTGDSPIGGDGGGGGGGTSDAAGIRTGGAGFALIELW